VAPAIMAVGGAISLAGSFLTWSSVRLGAGERTRQPRAGTRQLGRAGASFHLTGLDTPGGKTVLALSVALIVVALLAVLAYRFWLQLSAMAAGLVLGVIALVWSATDLASPSSMFGVAGLRFFRRGIPVSSGLGVYLAVAGGALAVVAAVAWLVMSRARWASPAAVGGAPVPA